ncbi:hypothetical protein SAMN06295905_1714 [Devosia lucknowensis]|uniref:Uncharacterized protein n=1 Tax=Devosia lucknowensis TaxID=1096929 RepID=A0A1Y6FC13_9HYPH|nr:hypothetical protein [Devosia lucknowensis]SMQ69983.1 hypothetical protein SAMN06295905_1714 [Devosia lucknowensis]
MKHWMIATAALTLASSAVQAGESGDQLAASLYDGSLSQLAEQGQPGCDAGEGDACFLLGLDSLISGYETFAQALYRHGAVSPDLSPLALVLGSGIEAGATPANPDPEPLTYDQLRDILDDFVTALDAAAVHMQQAGEGTDFVIPIDPLLVRIDLDGDGERGETETLGVLLAGLGDFALPEVSEKSKSKGVTTPPEFIVGFDNADAIWFAGYANVTAAPFDLTLAHDFSAFFDAYLHRLFPEAGLPLAEFGRGSTLMVDPTSDAMIADLVAALHTANFPVIDQTRLAGVRERLLAITSLSRKNWEMILAETDDNRELVPAPSQTSIIPGQSVTQEIVDAWLATLDQVDLILEGELLLPHWRFTKGFDLKAYFDTATKTDIVMLFTGHDALPYLADGPIADAESFSELNRVMGDDWPFFALWFN